MAQPVVKEDREKVLILLLALTQQRASSSGAVNINDIIAVFDALRSRCALSCGVLMLPLQVPYRGEDAKLPEYETLYSWYRVLVKHDVVTENKKDWLNLTEAGRTILQEYQASPNLSLCLRCFYAQARHHISKDNTQ